MFGDHEKIFFKVALRFFVKDFLRPYRRILNIFYVYFFGVISLAISQTQRKLKNCVQCGRIFSPIRGEKICRDCKLKEEEIERVVIAYVRDNPGCSIKDAMEATGVSEKIVKRMVREGMFVNLSNSENFVYPCIGCGKPIRNGTYCADCLNKLRSETKKAAEAMHIRVREEKKMSTIERLNAAAKNEFERENRIVSRSMQRLINRSKNVEE